MAGTYTYNNQMQLGSLQYGNSASNILSLSYNYGGSADNGQIQGITDSVNSSRSTSYVYDQLGRLQTAQTNDLTSSNTWQLQFAYDRYGNRLSQTPTGGTASMPSNTVTIDPSTNHINTGGYAYDAAGNMTSDSLYNYTFNAASEITFVTPVGGGGAVGSYGYDANGLRVFRNGIVDIYSGRKLIAEYTAGASPNSPKVEHIYRGELRLATIASGLITYHYPDHLSVRVQGDSNGNVTRTYGHYPFGETWYETGATDKWKFTSYENDTESGLNYASARFHSPRLGRFLALDSLGGSRRNPQSLNRYAYAGNDPVNLVDPSGQCDEYPEAGGDCEEGDVPVSPVGGSVPVENLEGPNMNDMLVGVLTNFDFDAPLNMDFVFNGMSPGIDNATPGIDDLTDDYQNFVNSQQVGVGTANSDAFEEGSLAYQVFGPPSRQIWANASGTMDAVFWVEASAFATVGGVAYAPTAVALARTAAAVGTGLYYQAGAALTVYGPGVMVIGRYSSNYGYTTVADQIGSTAFDVPLWWYQFMGEDAVIANRMAIQGAINNGFTFYLSNPVADAQAGTGFAMELQMLEEQLGPGSTQWGPIVTAIPR